jgi:hypothetical protein
VRSVTHLTLYSKQNHIIKQKKTREVGKIGKNNQIIFPTIQIKQLKKNGGEKRMKRQIIMLIVLTVICALLASSFTATASATPSTTITGSWSGSNQQVTSHRVEGANVFIGIENEGKYTAGSAGSITGNFHQSFLAIVHFKDPKIVKTLDPTKPSLNPPADFNWIDMDRVFESATVLGKTGGMTMRLQAKGYGNSATLAWDLEGTWVIIGGTGDLSGLHGQGTWWHTSGIPGLRYEGQVHIDP